MRQLARTLAVVAMAAVPLLVAGSVQAHRKPTDKELRQMAGLVDLPPQCAKVKVSTTTPKPKWASVRFRPTSPSDCQPLAFDGSTIGKKVHGTWRAVTAGSSFDCPSLYEDVPRAVAKDLGITCHS